MTGSPVTGPAGVDLDRARSNVEEWHSPPLGAHRLLADGRSCALCTHEGEIDWWCAPEVDDRPLLWSLLDPQGAAARWLGVELATVGGPVAGPATTTVVRSGGSRARLRDGLVRVRGMACLVRLARAEEGSPVLRHEVAVGGFDQEWGVAALGAPALVLARSGLRVNLVSSDEPAVDGRWLRTEHRLDRSWSGLALVVGDDDPPPLEEIVSALDRAEQEAGGAVERAHLPRHHPRRAADALAVLSACTYQPTGAVVAAPTTSLPEAPGADRQFDYRYCWLRDAALAVSVASLLGRQDAARRYLSFVRRIALPEPSLRAPLVDVRGAPVPAEREVRGVAGWRESTPVRVGNAAQDQLQYDSWGMVLEAVSVHLQTGGSLDDETWELVRKVADLMVASDNEPSSGIWELRGDRRLVSGDIGRWLALDRAIWIARGWRPWARRRRWKKARDAASSRVLAALGPDGKLPQAYDGGGHADASGLMVVLFGMIDPRSDRARRLVDSTLLALAAGPFIRRYPTAADDGFDGREGAFLPVTWWAVAALAVTGRLAEARTWTDELCGQLPRLLSEEVDPVTGESLGNTPLVWSHMELARALYILDAQSIRRRLGPAGLWAWRLGRYARLRWFTDG